MRERSFATRYGVAVAACAAALALRAATGPWLADRFPFIFLYPAVALAAWVGGFGPALLVTAGGALGAWWFLDVAPQSATISARTANLIGLAIFVCAALSIGLLGELARRNVQRAGDSERAKDEALEKLAASERLYRAAGELIPFGIWIADARGRATYLSKSFLDMLGTTVRPDLDAWALRMEPADYDSAVTAWQRTVDAGAASFEHEFRIRDKDGQVRSILSRGAPSRDQKTGAVTAWIGVHFDVTESKGAQRDSPRSSRAPTTRSSASRPRGSSRASTPAPSGSSATAPMRSSASTSRSCCPRTAPMSSPRSWSACGAASASTTTRPSADARTER